MTTDRSNPVYIAKGAINDDRYVREIIKRQPDLVIAYGCSIITEKLLSAFSGRFINVHLGIIALLPGSGTNFWPLVNAEPEFIGATFMHIDAGIDTGEIIHQIRPHIEVGDTPVQIGNRLIVAIAEEYLSIVNCFDGLEPVGPDFFNSAIPTKYYGKKDFTEDCVNQLYNNIRNGLIENYIETIKERHLNVPIFCNPAIKRANK